MELSPEIKINKERWYVLKRIKEISLRTKKGSPIEYMVYLNVVGGEGLTPDNEVKTLEKLEELGVTRILNPGGTGEYENKVFKLEIIQPDFDKLYTQYEASFSREKKVTKQDNMPKFATSGGIAGKGVTIQDLPNPDAVYWKFVLQRFKNLVMKNRRLSIGTPIVVFLFVAAYFGYVKYIPEFSFPVGTFKVGEVNTDAGESAADSDSKKLDRSIFDLAKETVATGLTSQERVNLISNISGLETKEEIGVVEDIGTDGLTLLIKGKSSDGVGGIIECDFSSGWKQRISLLKKGNELRFSGTVSTYDLSRQWIILRNCRISG